MSAGDYQGTPLKLMEVGVILVLAFLVAIFVTVGIGALRRPGQPPRVQMVNNARIISIAILTPALSQTHLMEQGEMGFPPPVDYPGSSTDYLTALVTNGYLNVDASSFGGAGVPMASGRVEDGTFTSRHNAWRIVSGITVENTSTYPLVISRNIEATYTNLSAMVPVLSHKRSPFGEEGLVVASIGGAARFIEATDLAWAWHQLYDPATIQPTRILPE